MLSNKKKEKVKLNIKPFVQQYWKNIKISVIINNVESDVSESEASELDDYFSD